MTITQGAHVIYIPRRRHRKVEAIVKQITDAYIVVVGPGGYSTITREQVRGVRP
jgi:hypothetical protein